MFGKGQKEDKTLDIEAQIDVAYQDWRDKFEEEADEADFFCTAIPNPVPLEGIAFISKYAIKQNFHV